MRSLKSTQLQLSEEYENWEENFPENDGDDMRRFGNLFPAENTLVNDCFISENGNEHPEMAVNGGVALFENGG
jgi:hypothetical protein